MPNVLSTRALIPEIWRLIPRTHVHGSIITPNGFVRDGTLVMAGGVIEAVHTTRTPAVSGGTEIDTRGLISPGFVDTHNHASFAAFRRWKKPARYMRGRFDWRGKTTCNIVVVPEPDPYYKVNVSPFYKEFSAAPFGPLNLALYGQLRGIIGGATTMVIDADQKPGDGDTLPGIVRGRGTWPTRIWGILDVGCCDAAKSEEIAAELEADSAWLLVHCGEGTDEFSRGEFLTLELKKLLTRNTALIHAMALLDSDWQLVKQRDAKVIWSPQSNYRLYGRSIDIGQVLGLKIKTALAPDWTITGSSTVLDELTFVRTRYPWIDDQQLLAMVTDHAADVMGMSTVGRLEPGAVADLLVFPAPRVVSRAAAARIVVSSAHDDLQLVVVGGVAIYGVKQLIEQFPIGSANSESIDVPLRAGGTASRVLRLGNGFSYDSCRNYLDKLFKDKGLTLAPLWEAN